MSTYLLNRVRELGHADSVGGCIKLWTGEVRGKKTVKKVMKKVASTDAPIDLSSAGALKRQLSSETSTCKTKIAAVVAEGTDAQALDEAIFTPNMVASFLISDGLIRTTDSVDSEENEEENPDSRQTAIENASKGVPA